MTAYEITLNVLMLLGGLGAFLVGLKMMGDGLENASADKLRSLFNKISNNRFSGVAVGAGVTAIIQSSSATTVMVVGFVNAGVMTLFQATSIIMGANIGTTVTAQIMQLQGIGVTTWFAALGAIGTFCMMSKRDNLKKIGGILAGLGIIFVGLWVMSESMKFIAENEGIRLFFQNTSHPMILFLMGLALTAVIQSSSATTGILITLVSTVTKSGDYLMSFNSAIFAILGINVGTCVTAMLASIGTNKNAKRAALIHILFNLLGAVLFLPICAFTPLSSTISGWFPNNPETSVAMFHTFFNITVTLLLVWFIKPLVKLSEIIIHGRKQTVEELAAVEAGSETQNRFKYIDKRPLGTPAIALSQAKKEILFMASIAKKNLIASVEMVTTLNMEKQNAFIQREKHINFLNREIADYLIHLSACDIGLHSEHIIGSFYHVVSDIERVGDYAENITEYAEQLIGHGDSFSAAAIEEINEMYLNVENVFDNSVKVLDTKDLSLLKTIEKCEDLVDKNKFDFGNRHYERLRQGACTPESGAVFLSLISNLERIADHMTNVSKSVKDYAKMPTASAAKKPAVDDIGAKI